MRKLIGLLVAVAIIATGLAFADIWVRHRVQSVVADHIEEEVPGSTAKVDISSFPFVGHLAVSGTVPELSVDLDDVNEQGLTFDTVDLVVHDLKVDKSKLTSRKVVLQSISSGTVVATMPQSSVDDVTGIPVTLGQGTVGLAGIEVHPTITVSGNVVSLSAGGLPPVHFTVPQLSVLPCVGAAVVVPGAIQLSCQLTTIPPVLADFPASF